MTSIIPLTLDEVRRELWGKSHYYDADTMRLLRSRLLGAVKLPDGALLTLESYKYGENGQRLYRVVFLDTRGRCGPSDVDLPAYRGTSRKSAWAQYRALMMGGLTV